MRKNKVKIDVNMWDMFHQWETDLIEYSEIRLTNEDYLFFIQNSKLNFEVEKENDLNLIILID